MSFEKLQTERARSPVAETPMLRQYFALKASASGALLLFRLGDFYELFFEDAELVSRELGLTLTSRNKLANQPIPMCGVPVSTVRSTVARLVRLGHKVAIGEQVEDPGGDAGIIRREITQIITPGTVVDDECLEAHRFSFLAALVKDEGASRRYALAYGDITTGLFECLIRDTPLDLYSDLCRLRPQQLLLVKGFDLCEFEKELDRDRSIRLSQRFFIEPLEWEAESLDEAKARLGTLLGGEIPDLAVKAAALVARYASEKARAGSGLPFRHLVQIRPAGHLEIDPATRASLDLDAPKSRLDLIRLLDETATPMGARKLRAWISAPLTSVQAIEERLDRVEFLVNHPDYLQQLRELLKGIRDIERMATRSHFRSVSCREMRALGDSLLRIPLLLDLLKKSERLAPLLSALDDHRALAERIIKTLAPDGPHSAKEGGAILSGVCAELDEARRLDADGQSVLLELEARERKRTGIQSLKVKFNRVFGYTIEVTKSNLNAIPDDYTRKQTIAGGERFVTPELKELELKIIRARETAIAREIALSDTIREAIATDRASLLLTAETIAELDVLNAFSACARKYGFTRPGLDSSREIDIVEGRHPIVEPLLPTGTFVPNDIYLSSKQDQILMISGPNMAGKSTIMRQAALTVIMAQAGSFVPAKRARIGIVDRLFARIGAEDNLTEGKSTFMVEMLETATILSHATDRSFILLDEIGRGTSTYDGIAIAWAVAEYLHNHVGSRTLFATHYHELAELERHLPRVQNYTVTVKEWGKKIIFLRRLERGACSKSYGIQVAALANLPTAVIERARELIKRIGKPLKEIKTETLDLFSWKPAVPSPTRELEERLERLDVNQTTPLEALRILGDLQSVVRERRP